MKIQLGTDICGDCGYPLTYDENVPTTYHAQTGDYSCPSFSEKYEDGGITDQFGDEEMEEIMAEWDRMFNK